MTRGFYSGTLCHMKKMNLIYGKQTNEDRYLVLTKYGNNKARYYLDHPDKYDYKAYIDHIINMLVKPDGDNDFDMAWTLKKIEEDTYERNKNEK